MSPRNDISEMLKALGPRLRRLSIGYGSGAALTDQGITSQDSLAPAVIRHCPLLEQLELTKDIWPRDTAEVLRINSCHMDKYSNGTLPILECQCCISCAELDTAWNQNACLISLMCGLLAAPSGICITHTLHSADVGLPFSCRGVFAPTPVAHESTASSTQHVHACILQLPSP